MPETPAPMMMTSASRARPLRLPATRPAQWPCSSLSLGPVRPAAGSTTPRPCPWRPTPSSTRWPSRASSPRPSRTCTSATAPTAPATSARLAGLLAGLPVTTGGVDDPAPLLVGPERDRAGRQLHQAGRRRRRRRRRRRGDLDAQPGHGRRPTSTRSCSRTVPGDLHGDDRDRRHRRRALQRQPRVPGRVRAAVPAAHRRGPGARPVRGRDRADGDAR